MIKKWLILLALLVGAGIALPWLVLDTQPGIESPGTFQRADLAWLKNLFRTHDPRRQTPEMVHSLRLDESELNRLLQYAVGRHRLYGVDAGLKPDELALSASFVLPETPFGRYLNVRATVRPENGALVIDTLHLGNLPIPALLANVLAQRAYQTLRQDPAYASLADAYAGMRIAEHQVTLDYRWHPKLLARLERKAVSLLLPPGLSLRMLAYTTQLKTLVARYPSGSTQELRPLLSALMASPLRADAATENRAALTAIAAYLGGISLPHLLQGDSASIRRAPRVLLSLHGRRDFAEHFVISAALAINSDRQLANAIGLSKEVEDAGHGSGFSFTDLAANRAGIRLGERATSEAAATVRQQLMNARSDFDVLPDFRDLPEFMPHAEFERRYGQPGSPAYQRQVNDIDQRLAQHPLYHPSP